MTITIGLNFNHADSSACIFVDNELKSAIEEERINRIKHWAGIPIESIKFCLKQNNLKFSDIENITINTNPRSNLYAKINFVHLNMIQRNIKDLDFSILFNSYDYSSLSEMKILKNIFKSNYFIRAINVNQIKSLLNIKCGIA